MKNLRLFFASVILLVGLPLASEGALSFDLTEVHDATGYSTRIIDEAGDWDVINGGGGATTLTSDAFGNLTFSHDGVGPSNASLTAEITLINDSPTDPGTAWHINAWDIYHDLTTSGPGVAILRVTYKGVTRTFGDGSGVLNQGFTDLHLLGNTDTLLLAGDSDVMQFTFIGLGGGFGASSITLSGLSFTAIVPEPSSALILSGIVGCFVGFRRRRRELAVLAS